MPRTVTLGGVEISRMGLGTNRLTHTPHHVDFIRAAVQAGIGVVDTAHLYTGGESEETIGEALAGGYAAGNTIVATKGGFAPGDGRADILRSQIETSLRKLRTSSIDLYYLHRVHPGTPLEESLGVLREYVDRGQIRFVGISEVSVEQIEKARQIVPITAVQNEYNVSERKWEDVVDYCSRESICFVPFRPLHGDSGSAMEQIATSHGATSSQIALAWLLHRSPMILPIPGTLAIGHVKENLGALDIELTDDEYNALS
jgi:aryl-alcohol dehydrogenase-like predicted oxidoreductase